MMRNSIAVSFKSLMIILATVHLLVACKQKPENELPSKPNILFAIADDQSYPHASGYGTNGVHTPAFDFVARKGALFNKAFVAAPQCSPSRAAILTGRNIWQLEEAGTHASYFPKKYQVFTDVLEENGYELGYTGKPWSPGNWKDAGWKRNPVGNEFNEYKLEEKPISGINSNNYKRNFKAFMEEKPADKPFFFWFGCHDQFVPGFLPDHEELRYDISDYILEIEWFDRHLQFMIAYLEEHGELENTIIIVTADNGMPFPSAKANLYEYGTHVPLAICWPASMKGNRVINELVAMIDLAPTLLDIIGIDPIHGMSGRSFKELLLPGLPGQKYIAREFVLAGRERHTHARPDNLGYPARSIRTKKYLYIWNLKPNLWPAGNPASDALKDEGKGNFKTMGPGFHDVDASPSKDFVLENKAGFPEAWYLAFEKRPAEQLYDIETDPDCVQNLAGEAKYSEVMARLRKLLEDELRLQGDPRMLGYGEIFDSYPRHSGMRNFPGFKEEGAYNPDFIQENQILIK